MCKLFENSVFNRLASSSFNVILRLYSIPEVPRRIIHNVIAKAMSMFNNPPHSVLKRPSIPQRNEIGRSMIEMLGVLAIIAVLTVGGISGYSKAMEKWKSNIQRNALSEMMQNMIKLKPLLDKSLSFQNITSSMAALGDIPEGMTFEYNSYYYDKDKNVMYVMYGRRPQYLQYTLYIQLSQQTSSFSKSAQEYCHNLAYAAQAISDDIIKIYVYYFGNKDGQDFEKSTSIFDQYSLKNLSVSDIYKTCREVLPEGTTRVTHFGVALKPD